MDSFIQHANVLFSYAFILIGRVLTCKYTLMAILYCLFVIIYGVQ